MRSVVLIFAALALASCSGSDSKSAPGASGERSDAQDMDAVRKKAEAMYPTIALPEGAPDAPITGGCLTDQCEVSRASFGRQDWAKAWQGDYQAQRNVAYCRSNGCDGAVERNAAEACAWRSIIITAHVGKTTDSDTANLKMDCGKLDDAGVAVAITNAQSMYPRIYRKEMPKVEAAQP